MLAWVTNVSTSPDLCIEFSTDPWSSNFFVYDAFDSEQQRIPKGLANLKGKENPDLLSVCSNYWPPKVALSLYLTIWYFRPFGNAGLQCPRDLPSP